MDVSKGSAIERVARVLAAQADSANARGDTASASARIDAAWRDRIEDAVAVLHTLREPDEAMAAAGDPAIWERMILAALPENR